MTGPIPRLTKLSYLLQVCFLMASTSVAQNRTDRTAPGVVSGRVFAILKNGDLKPARMATLYLLWKYQSLDEALAEEKRGINRPSAELTFLDEQIKAMKAEREERERDFANTKTPWSDSISCSKDLDVVDVAIQGTLRWSLEQKKPDRVLVIHADEEGNFRTTGVHPGVYDMIARGRAGFNEAFWHTNDVESGLQDITVAAGKEATVKLAAPVKSCLKLSDDN